MFGYIKTDRPYLYLKDDTLYKSLYCGVCKSIGATCGQAARFSLTYDVAFLSAVAHNIMNADVSIKKKTCVAHPVIKRPIAERDAISDKLAAVNVLLAYYKVRDDVYDNGKGRIKGLFLKRGYKKAKRSCPEIDGIVKKYYSELTDLEKKGVGSVDMVADPFARMLAEISDEVFGEYKTEFTAKLFYAVGKWIYLIDALDDYDKDVKKKNYNVFYVAYGSPSAKDFLKAHGEEADFVFSSVFSEIEENLDSIQFYFNKDLINNILRRGVKSVYAQTIKRIANG